MLSKNMLCYYHYEFEKVQKSNRAVLKVLLLDKGLKTLLETVLRSLVVSILSEEIDDKKVRMRDQSKLHELQKSDDWRTKIESGSSESSPIR